MLCPKCFFLAVHVVWEESFIVRWTAFEVICFVVPEHMRVGTRNIVAGVSAVRSLLATRD